MNFLPYFIVSPCPDRFYCSGDKSIMIIDDINNYREGVFCCYNVAETSLAFFYAGKLVTVEADV